MIQRPRANHDDLIQYAHDALERDDLTQAEALARRALMLRNDSVAATQIVATSLIEQGRFEEATAMLQGILSREPEDLAALADLGLCLYEMCQFEEARAVLDRALAIEPNDPQSGYWMGLCLERMGKYARAEEHFRRAHGRDPEAYPLPTRISRAEFEEAIEEALDELPEEIYRQLDNLTIIAADLPGDEDLMQFSPPRDPCAFGLYVGVPLPERSTADVGRLPDTIYIYQRSLERLCRDRETLIREIRITLLHEIGHYLGYDEDDLEERGLA